MGYKRKRISDSYKEILLSLKPEDLTFNKMVELVGKRLVDNLTSVKLYEQMMDVRDEFTLKPSEYFVDKSIETTVGRFIFNKYLIERFGFQDLLGYVNRPVDAKYVKELEIKLMDALRKRIITTNTFAEYLNYRDTLGYQLNSVVAPSYSPDTISIPKSIRDLRDKLVAENRAELEKGNIIVSEKIEKALKAEIMKVMGEDPGIEMFSSGARSSLSHILVMNLYRGASFNAKGEREIITTGFIEGIQKDDFSVSGCSVISGQFPKSNGVTETGAMGKEINAMMQTEGLDIPKSDCGTIFTLDMPITNKNKHDFLDRYIQSNGKLILLTDENLDSYVGKTVQLRSPLTCKGGPNGKLCNICAGESEYRRGGSAIGLELGKVSTTLSRMGMKKFHVSTIESIEIDPDNMLL